MGNTCLSLQRPSTGRVDDFFLDLWSVWKNKQTKKEQPEKAFKDIIHRGKPNTKPRQCNAIRAQDSFLGTLRLYFEAIFCYRNIGWITILSQINSSRTNMCSPWQEPLLSYFIGVSWQKWEQAMAHGIVWKCWSTKQVWHFAEPLPRLTKKFLGKRIYNASANMAFNTRIIESDY